jgi:shikimate dehydrogenase
VIGSPIGHSLSPVLFNAAFAHCGLDWTYVAFEVPEGQAGSALAGMRAFGLGGLSVTMPHKAAVASGVDVLAPDAAALGAVNCVVPHMLDSGEVRLLGENTDGPGFLAALAEERIEVAGARVAVFGAGGAARAVVRALAGAGAVDVLVLNRTAARAVAAAALAGDVGRVGLPVDVVSADLVVNATSVGMAGTPLGGQIPLDPGLLGPGHVVVDLVYEPAETPLLVAAKAQGSRVVGGLGMLVHQAALAFGRWTGVEPPVAVMRAAAEAGLAARPPSDANH